MCHLYEKFIFAYYAKEYPMLTVKTQVLNDTVTFYHSDRIAVDNIGSGKIDELWMFVEEGYPKIIEDKRFNMGTDKLISWKENENPYEILKKNHEIHKLGGWEFLDLANDYFWIRCK